MGETVHTRHSLNLDFSQGRLFYGAAIVSALAAAGIVLNVIATLLMAPALVLLLLLVNDREIMGTHANGWLANLTGGAIVIAISLIGAFYGVITVFPGLLGK